MLCRFIDPSVLPAAAPCYGSAPWLGAVEQSVPLPLRVLGVEDEGRLLAWLPYHEVKRGPWKRALPLFIDTTGGPYFDLPSGLAFAEAERLKREIQKQLLGSLVAHVDFATLCPLYSDPRALPSEGDWRISVRATARLDLDLDPPPWSSQALRKLRKGANKGLKLEKRERFAHLEEAVENVRARHGIGHASLDGAGLCALHEALSAKGLLDSWCVLDGEGNEVAYGLVAPDYSTSTLRFWYNLNTQAGLKLYASDFLFHGLAEAYRGRFRWFDLCGTDDANLIEFKEKWASETLYSFALDYARKPWMRHALEVYSRLRR